MFLVGGMVRAVMGKYRNAANNDDDRKRVVNYGTSEELAIIVPILQKLNPSVAFRKTGSDDSMSCAPTEIDPTTSTEPDTQQLVPATDFATNTYIAEPPKNHNGKGDIQTQEDLARIHTVIAATTANIHPVALKRNSPNRAVSTSFLI